MKAPNLKTHAVSLSSRYGRRGLPSVALIVAALLAMATASACGGNGDDKNGGDGDGDGDGDGTGGNGAGTGGNGGDGDGDGTGGSGDGDGDGDGTGGNGTGGNGTGGNGITGDYNCDPAEGTIPTLALEVVESGFNDPVLVTHAGDERLFVVERAGRIHVIEDGSTVDTPFLDIVSDVDSSGSFGEMGMLGLAFHPDHAENGLLYVYYIQQGGAWGSSRVVEYSVMEDDPNQVDTSTEREVLLVSQPAQNHNGGQVTFGPDGMLYLGLGDGGNTPQYGQDETNLHGSLLRIDIDGREEGAYSIPSGNLSEVLETAAPEIFSYGLRNPYRYNFDPCTGDLYVGDVGQTGWEEVTITPSGVGQLNYGWDIMEGTHCYNADTCNMDGITQPQIEYERGMVGAAVVGGSVYRGSEIPSLRGKYFYADAQRGSFWYSEYNVANNTAATPVNLTQEVNSGNMAPVSVQNSYDGEIYLTNYGAGTVLKLVVAPEPEPE